MTRALYWDSDMYPDHIGNIKIDGSARPASVTIAFQERADGGSIHRVRAVLYVDGAWWERSVVLEPSVDVYVDDATREVTVVDYDVNAPKLGWRSAQLPLTANELQNKLWDWIATHQKDVADGALGP